MVNIVNSYLTENPYSNDGKMIRGEALKGFMLHSVATPQPDPKVFLRGWNKPSYTRAGISGFIGADAAYIAAPCLEKPGEVKRMPHGGNPAANNGYIGFEMCEPSQVSYNVRGTQIVGCTDVDAAMDYVEAVYRNAVGLFALLCQFHGKDPMEPGVILSHKEGYAAGIASNHGDPDQLWNYFRPLGLTMDRFRADVKAEMEGIKMIAITEAELRDLVADEIRKEKKMMHDINDVPKSYRKEVRELLDVAAIESTTPMSVNPDDIDLSEEVVRACVINKRYIDKRLDR